MSLSQKTMLVCLNIGQWGNRKQDKTVNSHVEQEFKTEKKVGNFTKRLLPDCKELEAISTQTGAMRRFFYENTLPWANEGARIISMKNFNGFLEEFRSRKAIFEQAVEAFIAKYPEARSLAETKLGQLFNAAEYPEEWKLREAYTCHIAFFPMPDVGDFRTEILDSEKQVFLDNMRKVEAAATKECFERLHAVVSKAADRLKDPKAVFRDTLVENIQEICDMLPKLNITDDADLEQMRMAVQTIVTSTEPQMLRASATVRQDTAQKLASITDKMAAFMGGAQ